MATLMLKLESIPPWCRFFQSQFVHRQICRHGSHRCRTSREAQSPERPDESKRRVRALVTVLFPAFAVHFHTSSCVAWGWKTLSSSKMRPFPLFSTLSEDSLLGSVVTTTDWPSSCWSSFSTGFTRHSTRMLPKDRGGPVNDRFYSLQGILFRFLHIPLSSTSCSWYFLRSATSFLYFSRRSLLASDISLIAAEICQRQKTETNSLLGLSIWSDSLFPWNTGG